MSGPRRIAGEGGAAQRPQRTFDWSVLDARPGAAAEPGGPTSAAMSAEPTAPSDAGDPSLAIRVNDLKQFAYCPRVVFYQYAMPVQRRSTFKMEHGKAVEPRLEKLEQRRTLRGYGLDRGTREFQVSLHSTAMGLSGRLDLLITTEHGAFPVDFKDTTEAIRQNHRVQICAYAMLIEDCVGRPAPAGFVYRVPVEDVTRVAITTDLRAATVAMMGEIRRMIEAERLPPPTLVRQRCEDCEYRNYCGDIF